jgi:hypothetical protein
MRVSIWEWIMFLGLVGCLTYGVGTFAGSRLSAKPLNEHASCELLIHRNHRNQSLAILNLGYAINEGTDISIGELETLLGCQSCHGGEE